MHTSFLHFFLQRVVMVRQSFLLAHVTEKILLPQSDVFPVEPECWAGQNTGRGHVQIHWISVGKARARGLFDGRGGRGWLIKSLWCFIGWNYYLWLLVQHEVIGEDKQFSRKGQQWKKSCHLTLSFISVLYWTSEQHGTSLELVGMEYYSLSQPQIIVLSDHENTKLKYIYLTANLCPVAKALWVLDRFCVVKAIVLEFLSLAPNVCGGDEVMSKSIVLLNYLNQQSAQVT